MNGFSATANFRDIGGLITASQRRVRFGAVYRSASPLGFDDGDRAAVEKLGIRICFDLRSDRERQTHPSVWVGPTTPRLVHAPVDTDVRTVGQEAAGLLGAGADVAAVDSMMMRLYENLPAQCGRALRAVLDSILGEGDSFPILVHCTAGKDRTGFVVAILLLALEVPISDVLHDYLRSNQVFSDRQFERRRLELSEVLGLEIEPKILSALNGVKEAYLSTALAELSRAYGSVQAYLEQEAAMSQRRFNLLHERLLSIES